MKASETKFQSIIEGTQQYVVPLFQRSYSWEKKEWQVLWDDLAYLCENNEPKSHFIGSIVTIPTISVPEGVAKYLLIDGQQRLTTIFILLTLLRDTAKVNGEKELAAEIHQTMLVNYFKKGVDYFKLLPTQADRAIFQNLIKENMDPQNGRILGCYQFFQRKLKRGNVNILALNKAITTRLSVVSIVLDHDDNPHLVFESLNAKGRVLTQSDLIRNYFFMRIHVNEQEEMYAEYWEPMQTNLNDNLTEFIRHFLMRNGAVVNKNDVYFTLKERVSDRDALDALREIAKFAIYYQKLIAPEKEADTRLKIALRRLNRLEVTTAYPFLLNCYHDYSQNKLSSEDFITIVEIIENFIVRRFVCNVPTNQLNKIFPSLYTQAQLQNASNLVNGVRSILQTRNYPKDSEFRTRLVESKLYGAGQRANKTKLILETLEAIRQHKEQVPFEKLTIEHIMPQTASSWWQQHLGENWQIDYELYLHTLGNLTLTAYNAEMSNDPFPKKRQRLVKSHLELNKYFSTVVDWNSTEIERRAMHLANEAVKAWKYFGNTIDQTVTVETVTGKTPRVLTILDQQIAVESWRDVLSETLNTIADLEPDLFANLTQEYPRFVSNDPNRFRRNRRLDNGYYIEVNLSAKEVYRFCTQAIESIDLSKDDWMVETR
ncbi:MAG: DUF262 domain-containing protein [Anaerolineae bacterium]